MPRMTAFIFIFAVPDVWQNSQPTQPNILPIARAPNLLPHPVRCGHARCTLEIRQQGPGTCPICGMALEPEEPSLDDAPNPELVDFTRRWWVSAALAVPLLILTMGTEFLGLHLVDPAYSPWI